MSRLAHIRGAPSALLAAALLAAAPADAACRIGGAKCIEVPEQDYTAPHAVGDRLAPGSFNLLLNATYHGLPPSDGTFWYARVDRHVYKVRPGTYEVLEDVTWQARRLKR